MSGTTSTQAIPYPTSTDIVSDYPALSKAAAETIDAALTATAWTMVPMASGWNSASGTLSYRLNGNNIELRGQFGYGASGNTEVAAGSRGTIGTLPAGARPATSVQVPVCSWKQTNNPQVQPNAVLVISTDGTIGLNLTGAAQYIQVCTSIPLG